MILKAHDIPYPKIPRDLGQDLMKELITEYLMTRATIVCPDQHLEAEWKV